MTVSAADETAIANLEDKIRAVGGPIERLFTMSEAKHEIGAEYPNVMPDGKGIVFRRRLTGQGPNEFEIMEMAVPQGTPRALARGVYARYATSGHLLIVTGDGKLLAMPFDPKKYVPKAAKPFAVDQQLCRVRNSPDGKVLVAGTFDGTVRRWDASTRPFAELPRLNGHDGWTTGVAFDPAGKRLFSTDSWGRLVCWTTDEKEPRPAWEVRSAHDGWVRAMVVSPDGATVATAGRDRFVRRRG